MNPKIKKYLYYGIGGFISLIVIIKIMIHLLIGEIKSDYKSVKKGVKSTTKEIKDDTKNLH